MRRVLALASFVALTALLPRGSDAADPAPIRLERLVPGSSLAFVSVENVGTLGARFRATALGRMLDDPEMKAFIGPIEEDVKRLVEEKKGQGNLPIPPIVTELLGKLAGLEGQASVALLDLGEGGRPTIAGCLDFGGRLGDFVAFLTRVKDDPSGDRPPLGTKEKDGRTLWTMGDPERPACFATPVGTALFLSTDEDWLVRTATGGGAAVDGALAGLPAFQRVRAATGGDALALSLWANVPALIEKSSPPARVRKVIEALGADQIEAAGYGLSFAGDGILDTIVVDAPKTDHGLLPMMPTKPVSHAALAWAPSTAFLFEEASFDFGAFLPKLRELLGRIDPEVAGEAERMLAKGKEVLGGIDLEKDVLAGLGSEYAYWLAMPETGGLYPELALAFDVKDPAAYEKTIEKVADALCAEASKSERVAASRRVIEWHGKRLHVIDLAGVERRQMVPFTPTICFTGGKMFVTLVPHAMKELLLRAEQGTANSGLGSQEDVKALLAAAPAGHVGFGYVDLQAVLTLLYDTAVPLAQTAAKPNVAPLPVRLDWAQLPPTRLMRPYFRSLGAFSYCDGKSLRISIHSPVGIALPIAMVAAVGAAFVMRSRAETPPFEVPMVEVTPDADSNRAAQTSADTLRDAVVRFHVATGKLPESLGDLTAKDPKSGQPYLEEVPLDPWGFGFVYSVVDAGQGAFEIRSWGPDGLPKNDDDVVASGAAK